MAEGRGWPEQGPKVRSDTPRLITRTRQQSGLPTNKIATLLKSLDLSLRRIPVEHLKDR